MPVSQDHSHVDSDIPNDKEVHRQNAFIWIIHTRRRKDTRWIIHWEVRKALHSSSLIMGELSLNVPDSDSDDQRSSRDAFIPHSHSSSSTASQSILFLHRLSSILFLYQLSDYPRTWLLCPALCAGNNSLSRDVLVLWDLLPYKFWDYPRICSGHFASPFPLLLILSAALDYPDAHLRCQLGAHHFQHC